MAGAISRPDASNHFMILRPVDKRVIVRLPDGTKLAETTSAIRLLEGGKSLYDPVIYLPKADLSVLLRKQAKTTHCPLKGDASYFTFKTEAETHTDIAWSYEKPLDFSKEIEGLVAFYSDKVVLEEHPI